MIIQTDSAEAQKKAFPAASHPRYANTFQYMQAKNAPVHDTGASFQANVLDKSFLAFSDASRLLLKETFKNIC